MDLASRLPANKANNPAVADEVVVLKFKSGSLFVSEKRISLSTGSIQLLVRKFGSGTA